MNVPPLSMWLTIEHPTRSATRLWLPLFLVWLLLLPVLVIAFAATIVTDLVLYTSGRRYHHYTLLLLHLCEVLGDSRGLIVRVKAQDSNVDMAFL